jgi:hypothetical protein
MYGSQVICTTLRIINGLFSNGKLPLRTCPECSMPEPYRLPNWALVPAKTGPRAEYQSINQSIGKYFPHQKMLGMEVLDLNRTNVLLYVQILLDIKL